jgi:hypothetical protein
MLIFDRGFPTGYQRKVRDAVEAIRKNPNGVKLPRDLRAGLDTVLDGIETYPSPIVTRSAVIAYDEREDGPFAYTGGSCIWLCRRALDAGQDRLNATLFHELVHVMCGWELDAEVFEDLLFYGKGATHPDQGDIDAFARRNWVGRWVRVVKEGNGEVVVKDSGGGTIPNHLGELPQEDLAGIPNG